MKKSLMMLGAVAMVLASCTNEEVLNVSDSRTIGFSSFVGNNTRADIENATFAEFIVYGGYSETPIFNGVKVTKSGSNWTYNPPQYWAAGETYKFAAYAPAATGITASWNHNTGLTLNVNSDMSNQNDLIYAAADNVSADTHISNQSAVDLDFKHLLSKVSFKFTKENASLGAQKVEMSNFKVSGINTKSTWVAGSQQGTPDTPVDYTAFGTDSEIDGTDGLTTDAFYVIPQNIGTFKISASVKVTDDANTVIKKGTITATVPTTGITSWIAQNVYVYTAEITMSSIDDGDPDTPEPTPIVFSGSVDDNWTSGSSDITVDVPSDQGN